MTASKPWVAPALLIFLLAACASSSLAPVLLTLPPAGVSVVGSVVGSVAASPGGSVGSVAAPVGGTAAASAMPSVRLLAVRRVNIPEYLVARRVRYRADASTLAEWPNTYWAERIEVGVSREFVSALRQQLPAWTMCDLNCADQVPALTVQVDLLPMDFLRSAQKLQAGARITLSGPGVSPKVIRTVELAYDLPASADTAQAQAQTMATLIQQVAAAAAPIIRAARP